MDEHVCEWEFAETQQHEGPTGMYGCVVAVASCKHCGLELGPHQMEARLNATERLSAEKARCIASLLVYDRLYASANEVKAYANILEGKCH